MLFGHWPAPEPRRGKKAIGLDTGCVYGYNLTAYIIETEEFFNVPALRAYRSDPKLLQVWFIQPSDPHLTLR